MNVIQQIEAEHAAQLPGAKIPAFQPGDTVIVNVKVAEGERTRVQAYEGVCIARSGDGLNENFTVRKISYGEGVERVFPVYSPMIDSVKVVRRGKVRRAKLYYLRDRRGKSARIAERVETPERQGGEGPLKRPPRNKAGHEPRVASKQGRRRSRRLFRLCSMTNEQPDPDPGGVSSEVVDVWRRSRSTRRIATARPSDLKLEPGAFVRMPLGTRVATGVVWSARAAGGDNLKPIAEPSTGRRSVRRCATSSTGRPAGHWRRAACSCAWRSAPAKSPSRPRRSSASSRPARGLRA